jgi:hypothetical protein
MKLYLINEVLYDYTAGMVAIAVENLEQCRDSSGTGLVTRQ